MNETRLRDLVRTSLEAEAGAAPAFEATWQAAARRAAKGRSVPARRPLVLAGATAGLAALAVALAVALGWPFAGSPRAPDAALAADLAAAAALRARIESGSPLEPLLASMPTGVAAGLPSMPDYRYPLLPEETLL